MKKLPMTEEQKKESIKHFQYLKGRERKRIRDSVGAFVPIFMTADPTINKSMQEKAKETIKGAKDKIKFYDKMITDIKKRKLKKVM